MRKNLNILEYVNCICTCDADQLTIVMYLFVCRKAQPLQDIMQINRYATSIKIDLYNSKSRWYKINHKIMFIILGKY